MDQYGAKQLHFPSGASRPLRATQPSPSHGIVILQMFLGIQERLVTAEESRQSLGSSQRLDSDLDILIEGVQSVASCSLTTAEESPELPKIPLPSNMDAAMRDDLSVAAGVLKRLYKDWEAQSSLRWNQEWPSRKSSMHVGKWWLRQDDTYTTLVSVGQILGLFSLFDAACCVYEEAIRGLDELRRETSHEQYRADHESNAEFRRLYFLAARSALRWEASVGRDKSMSGCSGQPERAFKYMERGTERILLDELQARDHQARQLSYVKLSADNSYERLTAALNTRRKMLDNLHMQNADNTFQINRIRRQIDRLEVQCQDAASKTTYSSRVDVVSLKDVMRMLPASTAILQYRYEGNTSLQNPDGSRCAGRESDNFILWKISNQGICEVSMSTMAITELEERLHAYYSQCSAGSPISPQLETFLAETLLPSTLDIDKITHLIIVRCQALYLTPFHALPYRGSPLIASHSISYFPSVSAYVALKSQPPMPHLEDALAIEEPCDTSHPLKILAIGNPSNMASRDLETGSVMSLNPLPGAGAEARYITQGMPNSMALVGKAATKQAIFQVINDFNVIHVATHGYFNQMYPTLSAIAVADGESISIEDLMGRNMQQELVVLSACQTAGVSIAASGSIMGFARAFLAAGARNVLLSLWPIDDTVTVLLMRIFYRHLSSGDSMAESLRAAELAVLHSQSNNTKQELIKMEAMLNRTGDRDGERVMQRMSNRATAGHYSHAKYWAPFILIGADVAGPGGADQLPPYQGSKDFPTRYYRQGSDFTNVFYNDEAL